MPVKHTEPTAAVTDWHRTLSSFPTGRFALSFPLTEAGQQPPPWPSRTAIHQHVIPLR
eukprot:COSAG02_NODE_47580_length_340_cov_0.705394_1_plen_57_part_10